MSKWQSLHGKALVCVHWRDADASSPTESFTDRDIDSVHKITPMESYGLLMRDDPTGVTIMTEYYMDAGVPTYRGRTTIPREQVVRVEVLLPAATSTAPPRRPKAGHARTLPDLPDVLPPGAL